LKEGWKQLMTDMYISDQSSLIARFRIRLSCCLFAGFLAAVVSALSLPASAQQQVRQQYGQPTAQPAARSRRPAPVESVHRAMTTWPNTVPIPLPPDAKFVAGYQSQYISSKNMTMLRFTTVNPAATVLDWYKRSLQSAGWTVKEMNSVSGRTVSSISGTKNGVSCSINVIPPISTKDRTSVTLSYTDR